MIDAQIIGITGRKDNKNVSNMAFHIFQNSGYNVALLNNELLMLNESVIGKKEDSDNISFFLEKTDKNLDFFIIDTDNIEMLKDFLDKNKIHTLVDTKLSVANKIKFSREQIKLLMYNNLNKNAIGIVNSDIKYIGKSYSNLINKIVITYGLSSKATITASSLDINDEVTFNCCLQRGITTFQGNEIEQMEFPVKLYYYERFSIYDVLPVIALGLLYGISIQNLTKSLLEFRNH